MPHPHGSRWLLLAALVSWPLIAAAAVDQPDPGQHIYQHGIDASGAAVLARRNAESSVLGAEAACMNCHRRSGLGGREGRSSVPPITGRYLSRPRSGEGKDSDVPYVEGMRGDREPYSDALLARAIRDGLDSQGAPLNFLMPRYALGDADMAALIAYLKRLDVRRVPGVTDSSLHFATIVTPDADPLKRQGMLDVMKQFFIDRNARQTAPAPHMISSGRTAYSKSMLVVQRRWVLHVWELKGPESTWRHQLERHLADEPVFAVISGLGGRHWAPVHEFCEQAGLPCLFPNVEVPVDRPGDVYSRYFSKGVLLEAALMAGAISRAADADGALTVRQVYRVGDAGEAGAAALAAALQGSAGITVSSQALPSDTGANVAEAVRAASDHEALVLWLRPGDLAAVGDTARAPALVFASGTMGGLERAPMPPAWRQRTWLAYPFDLPEQRRARVDYALGWFSLRHIPVVAEQVQVDTYLACGLLSETLRHMVDLFVRDYLVERTESMLEHRILTGYYPRLSLAPGQNFASKGGYLVRWQGPAGARIAPEGEWTVP